MCWSLFGVGCLLFVACCVAFGARRCMWCAVCGCAWIGGGCVLVVVSWWLVVVCWLLVAVCCVLFAVCGLLFVSWCVCLLRAGR